MCVLCLVSLDFSTEPADVVVMNNNLRLRQLLAESKSLYGKVDAVRDYVRAHDEAPDLFVKLVLRLAEHADRVFVLAQEYEDGE